MHDHDVGYDLICIGCGAAGEKAATQAAWYGHRVAVIDRQPRPGGAMVNTGTVPSKALRETALLCSALRRRPLPGVTASIDRGRGLSVPRFSARAQLVEQQEHDRIESSVDRHGIDIHHGRARLRDAHTVEVEDDAGDRRLLRGRFILIATGSTPVRPAHVPFDDHHVVDADGILRLDHLPDSLLIVGGGVIGCEYASIFAEIDVDVTLLHPHEDILPFVDPACRDRLVQAMGAAGVRFRLGTAVSTIETTGDGVRVTLADDSTVTGATLLWAAGRRGNTDDLGLEAVGLAADDRGALAVDEHYRTAVPSIYAAGDVIGFPALAATSMEQGRVAACSMFDIDFKQKLADDLPIGVYTIPAISMVGLNEAQARERGHDPVVGQAEYRANARGRMLGDETGLLRCVFDRRTRALLGASIVGEDATELIHVAQSIIAHGSGIDYLIDTCFNYPSISELYKYAAYSALQAMTADEQSSAA
ncbi:MAG: Si-specific NAD(P)(+) transhydrogenase [Planctomycetota bacterium]|jgi:NAD(P) transhydrogenase